MTPGDVEIQTARVFLPLLQPARYKGAHGGRGSGKSHFFGEHLVEMALAEPGLRAVCIREVQRSIKESSKRLIEDKIAKFGLGRYFDVQEAQIRTPGDGLIIFNGMQSHTSESIKSLEGYRIAWIDEAQSLSQRSLDVLRPTMRGEAEIWASWNPQSPEDPIDALLRGPSPPPRSIVVEANWNDNPWLPDDLREEMEFDRATDPDKFAWVWGGGYEPRSGPGRYFKAEWLLPVEEMPQRASLRIYGGSDYAVTDNGGDYTVHAVLGLDADGNPWLLDIWREQASSDVWVASFCDLVIKWKPIAWAEETGQIKSGVGPFLTREMRERRAYCAREQFPTRGGDKAVRAQSFRGMIATRGLRIPAKAPWRTAFENELLRFPAGVHDDQVDACLVEGTAIRMADGSERPIEFVEVGDMVATPLGPCKVTASGVTNDAAKVYRVKTSCGRELVATGAHPVHVERKGFVRVDALGMMDQITLEPSCYVEPLRAKSLSIAAIVIAGTLTAVAQHIAGIFMGLSRGGASFIGMSGKMSTGRSRPDTISTTSTATRPTTQSIIWPASQSANTDSATRLSATGTTGRLSTWVEFAARLLHGTLRLKAKNGTVLMVRDLGKAARLFERFVRLAAQSLTHSWRRPGSVLALASSVAMAAAGESAAGTWRVEKRSLASAAIGSFCLSGLMTRRTAPKPAGCVIEVEALSAPARVRNLTVSRAHVFYANGLLTHNCGLIGQLLDMMSAGPKPPKPEQRRLDDYSSNQGDPADCDPLTI